MTWELERRLRAAAGMSTPRRGLSVSEEQMRRPEGRDEEGEATERRAGPHGVQSRNRAPPFSGLQEATGGVRPQAQFPGLSGEQVLGALVEKAGGLGSSGGGDSRGRLRECVSLLMPGMRGGGKRESWLAASLLQLPDGAPAYQGRRQVGEIPELSFCYSLGSL